MGMRLLIKVYNKEEKIAQAYYHWSGHSISSTEIVKAFIDCYTKDLKDKRFYEDDKIDMTYKAVKALEASGAKPWIYDKTLFDYLFSDRDGEFRFDDDSDAGLICIQRNISFDWQFHLDIHLSEEIVSAVILNSEDGCGDCWWGHYDSDSLLKKVRLKDSLLINKDKLKHEHEILDYWKKHKFMEEDCYKEIQKKINSKRYVLNEDMIKVSNYDVPFKSFYDIPFDKYDQVYDFLSRFNDVGYLCYEPFSINGEEENLYQLI